MIRILSEILNLPVGFFSVALGTIATIICSYIYFYLIPKKYLLSFTLAGLISGISSFILWFSYLGPLLLP
ncbi:MAG: hypothetical protein ACPG4Z_03810 [Chitinophagales bacterium]